MPGKTTTIVLLSSCCLYLAYAVTLVEDAVITNKTETVPFAKYQPPQSDPILVIKIYMPMYFNEKYLDELRTDIIYSKVSLA